MNWRTSIVLQEFRKILAYRSDFWVTFLGQTFIQLAIARALWQALFEAQNTTSMNGYTLEMMTLYYLIAPIGTRMLTGQNIGFIATEIYEGTFSRYLIYPLSVFQYKTLTYLTNSLFFGLQLILLYSLYQLFFVEGSVTLLELSNLILGVGIFLIASITYCMLVTCIELIALWADNIWSLVVMMRFATNFLGGGLIPLSFFPNWALNTLTYTPFPYLVSLPIKTIMGHSTLAEIGFGLSMLCVWGTFFFLLSQLIWKRGQKVYTGVGI
jgi:ABC-2 type transport system permease protein